MTASAATAGYQGIFKVSTVALIQIQSCEITSNGETYDVTVMSGSSTPVWKAFISGLRSATIKVVGFWDQVNDADQSTLWTDFNSGAAVAISFSPNTGTNTFSGNAVFTSIPMKFPVNGAETAEWDFQVTGALSYA
jgi:predicted secreted protein